SSACRRGREILRPRTMSLDEQPQGDETQPGAQSTADPDERDAMLIRRRTRYDVAPGDTLGHYRIERRLGAGGMGEVFAAVHVETGERVALKVLAQAGSKALFR